MPAVKKGRAVDPSRLVQAGSSSSAQEVARQQALDLNTKSTLFEIFTLLDRADLWAVAETCQKWRSVVKERNMLPLDVEVLTVEALRELLFPKVFRNGKLVQKSLSVEARRQIFSTFAPSIRVLIVGKNGLAKKDPISKFLLSLASDTSGPLLPNLKALDDLFVTSETNIPLLLALSPSLLQTVRLYPRLGPTTRKIPFDPSHETYLNGLADAPELTELFIHEPDRSLFLRFDQYHKFAALKDAAVDAALTPSAFTSLINTPTLTRLALFRPQVYCDRAPPQTKQWLKSLDSPSQGTASCTSSSIQELSITFDEFEADDPTPKLLFHHVTLPNLARFQLETAANHTTDVEKGLKHYGSGSPRISVCSIKLPASTITPSLLSTISAPTASLFQSVAFLTITQDASEGWNPTPDDSKQFLISMNTLQHLEIVGVSDDAHRESDVTRFGVGFVSLIKFLSSSKTLISFRAHVSINNLRALAHANGCHGTECDETIQATPTLKYIELVLFNRDPANVLDDGYGSFLDIFGMLLARTLPNTAVEDMDIWLGDSSISRAESLKWGIGARDRVTALRARAKSLAERFHVQPTNVFAMLAAETSGGSQAEGRVRNWVQAHLADPLASGDHDETKTSNKVKEAEGSVGGHSNQAEWHGSDRGSLSRW